MIRPGKYRCNNRLICVDFTEDCPNCDDELLYNIKDCLLKCACLSHSLECKRETEITVNYCPHPKDRGGVYVNRGEGIPWSLVPCPF